MKIRDKAEITMNNGETIKRNLYAFPIGNTSSILFRYEGSVYYAIQDGYEKFRQGMRSSINYWTLYQNEGNKMPSPAKPDPDYHWLTCDNCDEKIFVKKCVTATFCHLCKKGVFRSPKNG